MLPVQQTRTIGTQTQYENVSVNVSVATQHEVSSFSVETQHTSDSISINTPHNNKTSKCK